MLQGVSIQSRVLTFVGALLVCCVCLCACPMAAYADSVSGEGGAAANAAVLDGSKSDGAADEPKAAAGVQAKAVNDATLVAAANAKQDALEPKTVEASEGEGSGDKDDTAGKSAQTPVKEPSVSAADSKEQKTATTNVPATEKTLKATSDNKTAQMESKAIADSSNASAASAVLLSKTTAKAASLSAQSGPLVIVIDPGHGGYDGGANKYVVEKDVNLTIANYLKEELQQYTNVKVYMTRTNDTYVSLGDRVSKALNWGADVVISIHNNAGGGRGAEVIVPNNSSWYYSACYTQGQKLGYNILNELKGIGLLEHQGVYSKNTTNGSRYADGSTSDYFTLIEGPREYGILGIIVEHAFVDNATDAQWLQGNANLKKLALADARGIVRTYGLSKVDLTKVKYNAPLAKGTYVIATSNNGNQVLDVSGGSSANGANVLLWNYHNADWQKWEVTYDSQGLYVFKNVGTKKVLDVAGAEAFEGTNILTWQNKTSDYYNQRFVLVKSGNGYIIKSVMNTSCVLDCMGGGSANGTNIALWSANGGGNQRWCFVNLNPKVAFGQTISNGVYTLGVSNKKSQLVEIEGCSRSNGGNVDLYAYNGGSNQQWSFQYNGAGYYKIVNVHSGLVLDVEGQRVTSGANVLQWQWNGGKNQLWGVKKINDNTVEIYSALNGLPLDVYGASTANLANIETYYYNGGSNQRFIFEKATNNNIMGASTVTVDQMVKYYGTTGASYPSSVYRSKGAASIRDYAKIALEEANAEGVRVEVLFAQAMLETGNLRFGGDVSPGQCNFGGIGAIGGGEPGNSFKDVRTGLRAQVQHLKAYASTAPLNNACVDPRFNYVKRGSATTVQQLSGKWAGDPSYGNKITTIINNIKKQ